LGGNEGRVIRAFASVVAEWLLGFRINSGKSFLARWWPLLAWVALCGALLVHMRTKYVEGQRAAVACEARGAVALRTVDGEFVCVRGVTPW
jgi:hypothetical protein